MKHKFIVTKFEDYLLENYDNIHNIKHYLEDIFDIKISETLGDESIGVAYLTTDNRVLKMTPSISEIYVSDTLLETPNEHFPQIYKVKNIKITNNWWGILKEYIEPLPKKIKKDYNNLEKQLNDWVDDYEDNILFIHKLIETIDSLFIEYLKYELPELVWLYNQLMDIVEYVIGIVQNNAVDIHVDNLGIKNNQIVLFDY